MAFMRKCDRCKKAYDSYNCACDFLKPNSVMFANLGNYRKYWQNELKDLCPECMDELISWWEKNGNDISGQEIEKEINKSGEESGDVIIRSQA